MHFCSLISLANNYYVLSLYDVCVVKNKAPGKNTALVQTQQKGQWGVLTTSYYVGAILLMYIKIIIKGIIIIIAHADSYNYTIIILHYHA